MNGRTILSIAFGLIIAAVLVGVGVAIYDAGVSQGIADAGRVPVGQAVAGAYRGWGVHGFGLLGLIFPILFILLLVGIARAAFGRGRRWGPMGRRGWGPGHGFGDPGTWTAERERFLADVHRRLHEEADERGSGGPA